MWTLWLLLALFFAPLGLMLVIVWISRRREARKQWRDPVSEKLLRPAGESTRLELDKLNEKLDEYLVQFVFMPPLICAGIFAMSPADRWPFAIMAGLIAAILAAIFVPRVLGILRKRNAYRLGFAGERAVAEELNLLMLDDCRVFHDVPMDPYGNIDHVIVAPSGVFAVETKARRKRPAPPGKQRDYEVIFDGQSLAFPHHTETKPLEQAKQQASRLRDFLSKAVGEPVPVSAILTFPGWFITTRARSETRVLNPKNIRTAVLDRRLPELPEQLRKQISHQLDQRCRVMAF